MTQLGALLLLGTVMSADTVATPTAADSALTRLAEEQITAIETRLKRRFFFQPVVRFGVLTRLPLEQSLLTLAYYLPDSQTIVVNQKLFFFVGKHKGRLHEQGAEWLFGKMLPGTLRHELGHALTDGVSRELRHKPWPWPDSTTSPMELLALKVQCEGLAELVKHGPSYKLFEPRWFPKTVSDPRYFLNSTVSGPVAYEGGYSLVGSLAYRFGINATINYTVTHPIPVPDRHFRAAIVRWHRQAQKDLAKPTPP